MSKKVEESYLFSVGTRFSKKINEIFYKNKHYVWCTTLYDCDKQPITSNPKSICKRLLEVIHTKDRHAVEIENNIAGVLRGAQAKLDKGEIDEDQFKLIGQFINLAEYDSFFPIIYIIDVNKVGEDRCKEVPLEERASDCSIEYKIEDLSEGEFQVIDIKALVEKFISNEYKRVGE